jgi:hypothetical protein
MPSYNFFEPKRSEEKGKVIFAEFRLNTEERNALRKPKQDEGDKKGFQARKMPEFNLTCVTGFPKPNTPKKLTTFDEFKLTTNQRGDTKAQELSKKLEQEK